MKNPLNKSADFFIFICLACSDTFPIVWRNFPFTSYFLPFYSSSSFPNSVALVLSVTVTFTVSPI
jgi:flagellar biosynthesis protein FliR